MWTVVDKNGKYVCESWNKDIAKKYADLVNGQVIRTDATMYSVNDN